MAARLLLLPLLFPACISQPPGEKPGDDSESDADADTDADTDTDSDTDTDADGDPDYTLGEQGDEVLDGSGTFVASDWGIGTPLPAVDWSSVDGKSFVTPPKDQGAIGSCVPFAAVGALESAWQIQGSASSVIDLSEQYLLDCTNASPNGYSTSLIVNDLVATGTVDEATLPYLAAEGQCDGSLTASWYALDYYSVTGTDNLKAALHFGPLLTRFNVYSDFFAYTGGIYSVDSSATFRGGHAVLLVGYDDAERYWLVKNSWGPTWGESGYFRISYDETASSTSAFAAYAYLLKVDEDGFSTGPTLLGVDGDSDGWSIDADCDDTDATIYPSAPEDCTDGIDQDCNGTPDAPGEACSDLLGCTQQASCDQSTSNRDACMCSCADGSYLVWEVQGVCGQYECPMNQAAMVITSNGVSSPTVSCYDELVSLNDAVWPDDGSDGTPEVTVRLTMPCEAQPMLNTWYQNGTSDRRSGAVIALDAGGREAARWALYEAYVSLYTPSYPCSGTFSATIVAGGVEAY